jgi:hypothetical protein
MLYNEQYLKRKSVLDINALPGKKRPEFIFQIHQRNRAGAPVFYFTFYCELLLIMQGLSMQKEYF